MRLFLSIYKILCILSEDLVDDLEDDISPDAVRGRSELWADM